MSTLPIGQHRLHAVLLAFLLVASLSGCNRETSNEAIGRGQTALLSGDYKAATRHLKRAVKLNPDNDIIHYNLGMAQLMATDYKGAERSFDKADKINLDGNTDALEALAEARRLKGDYKGAIQAFERAFSKVNRKAHLVAGLAICEMEQGNNEYAHQLLQEALATDSKDPIAIFNMAVLMQKPQFNKPTKAAELYARFITSSESATYVKERGRAIQAIADIGSARPDELQMQIDDLLVKARTAKNKADAFTLTLEALLLDQSNPDSMLALIKVLKASGRAKHAEMMQTNFKSIFPNDPRFAE